MSCSACGATVRHGASWCGQCHLVVVADKPTGRFVPTAGPPRSAQVTSRWRSTATTFGPVGRVSWTVGVLLVAALALFSRDPFAILGWCLIASPLILRSVWARGRVS